VKEGWGNVRGNGKGRRERRGRERKMGRPEKVLDTDILYDLMESGVGRKDIATEFNVSLPTLSRRIAKIQANQGLILQYRALQNLQLTELQSMVLDKITPDKIDEAPLRDLVFAYKILKERELVDTGKPTDLKGMMHYLIELERQEMAVTAPVVLDGEDADFDVVTLSEEGSEEGWEDLSKVIPKL
jgi:hypothetical protein